MKMFSLFKIFNEKTQVCQKFVNIKNLLKHYQQNDSRPDQSHKLCCFMIQIYLNDYLLYVIKKFLKIKLNFFRVL